jgi:hypothetical protein
MLVGATIAMLLRGLTVGLMDGLGSEGMSPEAVTGGAFLALAAGVVLPRRLVLWVRSKAWRRFVADGRHGDVVDWLVEGQRPDRPSYWIVLSIVALLAGVAAAMMPLLIQLSVALFYWFDARFVWSLLPLLALHFLIALAAAFIPLGVLGLAVSGVHHLCCPMGKWESRATTWLLIGAAAGVAIAGKVSQRATDVELVFLGAAMPALLLALMAGGLGAFDRAGDRSDPETADELPIWSDRRPQLTRACVVVVGGGAACAALVWSRILAEGGDHTAPWAIMLLVLGMGYAAGCRSGSGGCYTIGSFGVVSVLAGVIVAVCAGGSLATLGSTWPPSAASETWAYSLMACVSLAPIGFATGFGRRLLLTRVGSRSSEGAKMVARLFVCTSVTCWLTAPLALLLIGTWATLMLLALSLIVLGGSLLMLDPSPRGDAAISGWRRLASRSI